MGSQYDGDFDAGPSSIWDGEWEVAARVVRGAWYAEVRIPYTDLGNPDRIRMNIGRVGYGKDGESWLTAWKAPGWFKPLFEIDLTE